MPKYLFIRILEACNAGCFMCDFRHSKDEYRLSKEEYYKILTRSFEEGIRFVRFTGGEPLKHELIIDFVSIATSMGIKSSIISNGYYLTEYAEQLKEAGLSQIIVSIDGATALSHNRFRQTPDLFERAIEGLKKCKELKIRTRVNTVAGPHNYEELIRIQELLTNIGVDQWELSALKLNRPLKYSEDVRQRIISDIDYLYNVGPAQGLLKPMGKVWCGQTEEERTRYFEKGIPPTPDNVCNYVYYVRYYDAKNGYLFPCSMLPHRIDRHETNVYMKPANFTTISEEMQEKVEFFSKNGCNICQGCSASAAGFVGSGEDWEC
ncbi:radical SAM protein [Anoxybacillus sp. J5B_2022]|uniref:radical SAM protein n=1 Tax=Anoxybacillus sp. J5B_2022 TaxID=3003246 RepID=UPI002285ED02|nr:radical SAM protein [Anoxybacillus sp. J5B_2022]MCZ0756141.1 radical SAM protein [Anoxybacillus sp. J5B_2022]